MMEIISDIAAGIFALAIVLAAINGIRLPNPLAVVTAIAAILFFRRN